MKPFTETMRHDHPLTPADWVLEIGAHKGQDAEIFVRKYGCHVVAYEPVHVFYQHLLARFVDTPYSDFVVAVNAGASDVSHKARFGIHGEKSGIAADHNMEEKVNLVGIDIILEAWRKKFGRLPALVQINAEGGEYDIIEKLEDENLLGDLPRIQVQFHSVIFDHASQRAEIYECLSLTHDFLWEPGEFDTGWVGWVRR